MADIDKVINGVEHCFHGQECCGDIECPYYIEHLSDCCCLGECQENLKADILVLLKEQDAVSPYVTGRGESFETAETWWYACGNCDEALDPNDKYCRHCGSRLKWT